MQKYISLSSGIGGTRAISVSVSSSVTDLLTIFAVSLNVKTESGTNSITVIIAGHLRAVRIYEMPWIGLDSANSLHLFKRDLFTLDAAIFSVLNNNHKRS